MILSILKILETFCFFKFWQDCIYIGNFKITYRHIRQLNKKSYRDGSVLKKN